jgi:hypothetical protein
MPRFVYQRGGEGTFQHASNYTGFNFSVGSAEANYHNMDKTPLVINMGHGYYSLVINFFMDGRSDYYGFDRIAEKSGHLKSLHLKPFIISVQNEGEVLFLASSRDNTDKTAAKLESVITLPADAEIWSDNTKLNIFTARNSWHCNPEANNRTTWLKTFKNGEKPVIEIIDQDQDAGIGIQRKFEVSPQKEYKLKAHLKGQSISLYINFYDKNNNLIEREHVKSFPLERDEYAWKEINELAPDNAVYCTAWIYSPKKNTAEAFIDDLSFEEINPDHSAKVLGCFDFHEDVLQKFTVPENTNLFVKKENVVTAIRLIKALDVADQTIPFLLSNDGVKYGALRLTATHSTTPTGKRGTIAVWSYTAEGINDKQKFADFRDKVMKVKHSIQTEQNLFTVKVEGITGPLEITADVGAEKRILRQGMKTLPEGSLLLVNGEDVGRKILEKVETIKRVPSHNEP